MLNLPPQSGQNGTSWSFTHDTTDFSSAEKTKKHSSHILTYQLSGTEHIFYIFCSHTSYLRCIHAGSVKGGQLKMKSKSSYVKQPDNRQFYLRFNPLSEFIRLLKLKPKRICFMYVYPDTSSFASSCVPKHISCIRCISSFGTRCSCMSVNFEEFEENLAKQFS